MVFDGGALHMHGAVAPSANAELIAFETCGHRQHRSRINEIGTSETGAANRRFADRVKCRQIMIV